MTTASTYRLVDGSDELVLSGTNGASPILVVESEFSPARPRVVDQDRLGRSGKRDLTELYDSSEWSATLRLQGDGDLTRYEYLDLLKGFLVPRKRPYIYAQRDGWISERRAQLRGNGVSCVVGKRSATWLEVHVRAEMPDGVIEANEETLITLRPGATNVGWSYPAFYPGGYTPSNTSNQINAELLGNVPASPYVRIFGGCSNPRLFRVDDSENLDEISLTANGGMSIASGEYLDVDFANRRVFLNGVPGNSFYSKVDFSVSEWWDLLTGDNRLLFTAGTADTGCYAEIRYRDQWTP